MQQQLYSGSVHRFSSLVSTNLGSVWATVDETLAKIRHDSFVVDVLWG